MQYFKVEGETEWSGCFVGFCFLNRHLASLSRIVRVVVVDGGRGDSGVGSDEAPTPTGVGEVGLEGCSW